MTYQKEKEERRLSNVPRASRPPERVTPEMMAERVNHTRRGLIEFLTERRNRLGMTEEDMKQSPEEVLRKQQFKMRATQQALVDEYMQTRESVDMM